MEKYIYDKNNSLCYELQGDYYILCLMLDAENIQITWNVGRKASAVYQGASSRAAHYDASLRQAEQPPCGDRQPGNRNV